MIVSDTSDQADVNNCIASKIDVLGNIFFHVHCSDQPMMIFVQYFAFRERITPWLIGWVFEVESGGRNTNSTAFKPSIIGCAGQLSTIRITLRFSFQTFYRVLLPIHQKGNCSSNF